MFERITNIMGSLFGIGIIIAMFVLAVLAFKAMFRNVKRKFKPDANNLMHCESCSRAISVDAFMCPHCGQHYGRSRAGNSIFYCLLAGCGFLLGAVYGLQLFFEDEGVLIFIHTYFD